MELPAVAGARAPLDPLLDPPLATLAVGHDDQQI